jgi:replicative DNA helicase
MTNRAIPHDIPAERAALGCVLLDGEALERVADALTPEQFYLEKHALIFGAMLACYGRHEPPDVTAVASELRRQDQLDLTGGLGGLMALLNEASDPYRIGHYAASIKRTATLRRLIEAGGKITALGYDEGRDLDEALDEAEQQLFAVSQDRAAASEMGVDLSAAAGAWWQRVERLQNGEEEAGILTGWPDLDEKLLLRRGQFHIFAARPGVGKSALALALARSVASRGEPVDIYSLEMERNLMQDRIYAMEAGVDANRIQRGRLSDQDLRCLSDAIGRASQWPIHIVDRFQLSHLGLRGYARRRRAKARPGLLIVDHIGLLPSPKAENRNNALGEITRGFVHLALELNVVILGLSQLNREVEKRASKVPSLADLRDSGNLEQDAATVTFLHRPWLGDRREPPSLLELHNGKNRNGEPGWKVSLHFDPATMQLKSNYEEVPGYDYAA